MALAVMVLLPAAAGLWLVAAGRGLPLSVVRSIGVATAGVTGLVAVGALAQRPVIDRAWVPGLDLRWHLALDGISAPLVVLTAAVGVLVTVHACAETPATPATGAPSTFVGALLLVEAGALATFSARDAVLFFVAFELVLIPMWVLISRFGSADEPAQRAAAASRFVLYTAFGSTLMLVGALLLVSAAGTGDLDAIASGAARPIPASTQTLIAAVLVAGLAVKVPVFPLHAWLPPAHTIAPTGGSVLLAAVLLKMGTYGLVRLPIASVPEGFRTIAPVLAVVGVIGIVWGGLICLVERDIKRLVAYSSVAHMGFIVLGLASGTRTGLQAALVGNIAHGVVAALLFVVVGGLKRRWHSGDLTVARPALRETSPLLGLALVLGLAAGLGLPGLAVFWGEILALYAAWSPHPDRPLALLRGCAVVAALGAALAAAYSLRVARLVWVGDAVAPDDPARTPDTRGAELGVIVALGVAVVLLGLLPGLVLDVTAADVGRLIVEAGP